MKLGLLFGSFNPVHKGHLAIAQAGLKDAGCAEVWFMIQEHNPYKQQTQLASLEDRLQMVRLATRNNAKFKVAVTKTPSIITSLDKLKAHYRQDEFVVLMGQDLVASLPSWKDSKQIINRYQIYGYQRTDKPVSSEQIRTLLKTGQSVANLVPPSVARYLKQQSLYAE